ncbi:MAG: hypothetical protein R3F49_02295 [Planctomycetota bacterium]
MRSFAASLGVLLAACASHPAPAPAPAPAAQDPEAPQVVAPGEPQRPRAGRSEAGPDDPNEVRLGADWLDIGASAFEARVAALEALGPKLRFDAGSRTTLIDALAQPGVPATRAAVLLAHAAAAEDADALEALIARLERRAHAPSRSEAAGDVIAAAALEAHAADRKVARRLADLATGERPHPELDVRVECGRAALAGGRDEVIPFLLAVLRAETPAQALAPPDWTRTTHLYWAKARAADALNARLAGAQREAAERPEATVFRPDASWQDQMAAADALEAALRAARAL